MLVYVLVGLGTSFTVRTRAVQVRLARHMWQVVVRSRGGAHGGLAAPAVYTLGVTTDAEGATLTTLAVTDAPGPWATPLMTLLIFVFAFTSLFGNYAYVGVNLTYLGIRSAQGVAAFRVLVLAAVATGSVLSLELVWDIADIAMAGMALVNLTACTLLLRWVLGALRDYEHRMRTGTLAERFAGHGNRFLPGDLPGAVWAPRGTERR